MAGQQADERDDTAARKTGDDDAVSANAPPDPAAAAAFLRDFKTGTVIDGKYRVDKILGRGAMGIVAEATHLELREKVALKFLYAKDHATEEDFRTRFRREAKVSAKLRNEHITRVIDVGVWRDIFPFMVMDLLEGSDLRQVIRQQGKLPIPIALDYIVQICEGVAEAHAHGIVHRDLKPSNLFVTKRADGTDLVKVLDFGISKWTAQEGELDELTQTGVVLGSPKYMSPEQLFGSAGVDARADVWSIGAIFYEMLAGKPPYNLPTLTRICAELSSDRPPPTLHSANADVPDELEAVVMRCFLRAPEDRVQDVAELAGSVLEAVGAPFAGQVRAKIQSILDPKAARDALAASSGGMPIISGGYASLPISTSRIPVDASPASHTPHTPTVTARTERDPPAQRSQRGAWVAVLLLLVVIAIGALGFRALTADDAPTASGSARPPAASTTTAPSTASVATAASGTNAATASASTAPSNSAVASATVIATAATAPPKAMWGGAFVRPPPTIATTPDPTTAPPPPPPPATTQEPPRKKPNPLEDRQ